MKPAYRDSNQRNTGFRGAPEVLARKYCLSKPPSGTSKLFPSESLKLILERTALAMSAIREGISSKASSS